VVCHPHPLFGGAMTNKVAHTLAQTYVELGAVAVRFNFRGVGGSGGAHDDGHGEVDDVLAVIQWARSRWLEKGQVLPLWLAGFSFGAAMALGAALRDQQVACLITVAPALRWLHATDGRMPQCPWLVIQGDRDELVNVEEVRVWTMGLEHPPQLVILEGAEHFFHRRLSDVRGAIINWMKQPEHR